MEAPKGWYPDPQAAADERYWDGLSWSQQTRMHPKVDLSDRRRVAKSAEKQANSLSTFAVVISILGVVGGIVMGLVGLTLVADETYRPWGIIVIGAGVGGILLWVFIGTFAQTIAQGVKVLAAHLQD